MSERKNEALASWPPDGAELFTAHGLDCAVVFYNLAPGFMPGHHCGYVHVPAGHPWAGKHYDAIDADVHGGLTFARDDVDGSTWIGWDDAHYSKCERSAMDETAALAEQVAKAGAR